MPRNPRREAEDRLGRRYAARVLEPSPPAVHDGPWFADDPLAGDGRGLPVVSPLPDAETRWAQLAAGDPDLAQWCRARWLGPYARLTSPPDTLGVTRAALHGVATDVLAPARAAQAGGKIGLRWTLGGFGTPYFGDDEQWRVEGDELVRDGRTGQTRERLDVDAAAARWLGELYGFGVSVLEELRAAAGAGDDPGRVQIWPEHFDIAVEIGREADGARATYGLSPGDDGSPLPYLYVSPWAPVEGDLWNADGFAGAQLGLAELLAAGDQRAAALDFLAARRAALTRTG